MIWFFDTSVLVAAAVGNHPHNLPARFILEELLLQNHRGFTSAQGLAELYSVLTRTPFKPPLYPSEVWLIIKQMILPHLELVALTPPEFTGVAQDCAAHGDLGGRIHDAVHLKCVLKISADRIYTFNGKDCRALATKEAHGKIIAPKSFWVSRQP